MDSIRISDAVGKDFQDLLDFQDLPVLLGMRDFQDFQDFARLRAGDK